MVVMMWMGMMGMMMVVMVVVIVVVVMVLVDVEGWWYHFAGRALSLWEPDVSVEGRQAEYSVPAVPLRAEREFSCAVKFFYYFSSRMRAGMGGWALREQTSSLSLSFSRGTLASQARPGGIGFHSLRGSVH
jgi:hypothetical protein